MSRYKRFPYVVQVSSHLDPTYGHQVIEWLISRNMRPMNNFDFNMNGGRGGYITFYMPTLRTARMLKMNWYYNDPKN